MLDRQDIDALLIGSLYGELSSADEARLTAHLESHPADRTALADLTRARTVVRESRILQFQFDPPQSVSALLIQEAARRAPKAPATQSWFQRFVRTFAMHPAMAAAAMLVLVVGVAGTIHLRRGDQFANQTKDSKDSAGVAEPTMARPNAVAPAGSAAATDGLANRPEAAPGRDDFSVQLSDPQKQQAGEVGKTEETETGRYRGDANTAKPTKPTDLAFETGKADKIGKGARPRLEVTTQDKAPKDLDAGKPAPKKTVSRSEDANAKADTSLLADDKEGAASGAGGAPGSVAPVKNATPPPRATAGVDRSKSAAAPPPPVAASVEEKRVDPELAWAKEQHSKVIAQVKAGNCESAATLAVQISNRTPAYYAANVETDRTVKQCLAYITDRREKEAERLQKSRASKRAADEAAPAPQPTK